MRTTSQQPITPQALNTLMFAGLMLCFIAQQSLLAPSAHKYGPVDVAKAHHYQPRLPPPMLDPEQLNTTGEEAELAWDYWPH
jgi:hypothetical protein